MIQILIEGDMNSINKEQQLAISRLIDCSKGNINWKYGEKE